MLASLDWTAAGVIGAAAAAAFAALIGVVTLWVQMRALNRQLRSANYQQIVTMFSDFSRLLVDSPELEPAIYSRTYQPPATEAFRHKVDWAIGIRFGWFETVVIQRKHYGLLSRDVAEHWFGILAKELDSPAMRMHWDKSHDYYHPELRAKVTDLLARKA